MKPSLERMYLSAPARSAKVSKPASGMGQQHLRILLEDRGEREGRDAFLDGVDRGGHAAHVELDLAADQQRAVGALRAALADGDVEAVLRVGAVGDGLVEAAMLGLRQPVGAVADLVLRERAARTQCQR